MTWVMALPHIEYVPRVLVGLLLGFFIGLERRSRHKDWAPADAEFGVTPTVDAIATAAIRIGHARCAHATVEVGLGVRRCTGKMRRARVAVGAKHRTA